jgi:hypothetical protein
MNERSEINSRKGWLMKKGKRRWYKLRNNFLMWYTSELVRKAEKKG